MGEVSEGRPAHRREGAQLGVSAPAEGELPRHQGATNHLKLGFSMQTPAELRRGMELLMTAVDGV
ncbi:Hypothetical protein A7982_05798 [Minicystis rosea]|nr:Hypothetical protein A7982_05798 [Minicystis rosea]